MSKLTAQQILDAVATPTTREVGVNLGDASFQWAMRPPDQRYVSLEDLLAGVSQRRQRSQEFPAYPMTALEAKYVERGPQAGEIYFASFGDAPAICTNWSFSQYNGTIGGPPLQWLRDLPAPEAVFALNASIRHRGRVTDDGQVKLLAAPPYGDEPGIVRALTSPTYGRIWDEQVVRMIMSINHDGRWVVPGKVAGGGLHDSFAGVTKQNTTLYASDRDSWVFLVDETHPIDIDGDVYFRGFIVSNSEVGNASWRTKTFLFKQVCQNRCIWDAIQIREWRIRHTSGAPDRFLNEAAPLLAAYSEASVRGVQDAIRGAKRVTVAESLEESQQWLREQGFTQHESTVVPLLAERAADVGSDGDPTNLWDLVMAGTAYARELVHADVRVAKETQFGRLLDLFARPSR